MTRSFEEGRLRFHFGERWRVEKYDAHRDYRQKIGKLEGTGAVDFVGIYDEKDLYLIEVKDFRGFRIQSKERLERGQLALAVARKVRDTISGLVAAYRRSLEPEIWRPYVSALMRQQKRLYVALWLEEDRPAGKVLTQRRVVARGTLTKTLKGRLRWLTTKVAVLDREQPSLPELQVAGLPQPDGSHDR
ncbi:MAG: hypothetical protein GY856_44535 [bacterium]|nr:hypothetical protein [bacterium]